VCVCLCVAGSEQYRYSIDSGGSAPFTVNSLTGQLLTTGQLDHDTLTTYLLTVKAQLLTDASSFTLTQVTHLATDHLPTDCQGSTTH